MSSFCWDSSFETKLLLVDQQHFHLVELINQFGELVTSDEVKRQELDKVYQELLDYTDYHFSEEEQMMADKGIDSRHLEPHINTHQTFLSELKQMYSAEKHNPKELKSSQKILDFLIHWLAYHILGTDQNMARQIRAIEQGLSAELAYEDQERKADGATEPLIKALNTLFEQVTIRNQELMRLNLSLEQKVEERTFELEKMNQHFQELSLTDSLTGLPNRRHGMGHLSVLWQESIAGNHSLSCMMIDADHFKGVNDKHGHDAGDRVLCALSQTLQDWVRSDDLVCRLGGDEFLILCPKTPQEGALKLARQLHKKVNELVVNFDSDAWHGSISLGIATRSRSMANLDALIKKADEAVYEAKRAGKNCIKCASST